MKDYRAYKELYKHIGFFILLAAVYAFAFKVTAWLMWAHQCINASL